MFAVYLEALWRDFGISIRSMGGKCWFDWLGSVGRLFFFSLLFRSLWMKAWRLSMIVGRFLHVLYVDYPLMSGQSLVPLRFDREIESVWRLGQSSRRIVPSGHRLSVGVGKNKDLLSNQKIRFQFVSSVCLFFVLLFLLTDIYRDLSSLGRILSVFLSTQFFRMATTRRDKKSHRNVESIEIGTCRHLFPLHFDQRVALLMSSFIYLLDFSFATSIFVPLFSLSRKNMLFFFVLSRSVGRSVVVVVLRAWCAGVCSGRPFHDRLQTAQAYQTAWEIIWIVRNAFNRRRARAL